MKEFARSAMNFLLVNGDWIYAALIGAIVLILALSAFRAYRGREDFVYETVEKPLSASEYFMWATAADQEATEDDYFAYREDFSAGEAGEQEPSRFEYFVETYAPKLIVGCVFSLILMAVVAAPYLVIRHLA